MQSRERGAAHINIFYFLVMLVLFLGAVAFGYSQLTEKVAMQEAVQRIKADNEQLKHDQLVYDHYVQDLSKVVGETGTYEGRKGWKYDLAEGVKMRTLENVSLPDHVQSLLQGFARDAAIPESTATPVSGLLTAVKQVLDTKDKRIADLQNQATTLSAQMAAAQSAKADADSQKATEVAALNQEKSDMRQEFDGQYNNLTSTINGLRGEVKRNLEAKDAMVAEHSAQVNELNKRLNLQKAVNASLQNTLRMRNPPQEPDGKVISSSEALARAWINIGRKDMLARGTVFRITSPDAPGIKAHGRVTRVDYDRAEIEIFDLADRYKPVVKGDLIANDLYSPKLRRTIYLLGRFSYPLNKPSVKRLLERLGNTVVDKMGPEVDLVLVGQDTLNESGDGLASVTSSPDYVMAQNIGAEISTLSKVRDFLQIGGDAE